VWCPAIRTIIPPLDNTDGMRYNTGMLRRRLNATRAAACALAISVGLAGVSLAVGDSQKSRLKLARELLKVQGLDEQLVKEARSSLSQELRRDRQLAPYKNAIMTFLYKHVTVEKLTDHYAEVYAREFTSDELKELIKINESPTLRKYIARQAHLQKEMSGIAGKIVAENRGELSRIIRERINKRSTNTRR